MNLDYEKLKQIKKLLIGLAEYFSRELTPGQLAMYADDLVDLDIEKLATAIQLVRKQNKFFPMPSEIREAAIGSVRDEALEVASSIAAAMSRYGWNNSERARAFIGPVGWRVVEYEGGWENLCASVQNEEIGTRKAQWREMAAVVIKRGVVPSKSMPALSNANQDKAKELFAQTKGLLEQVIKPMPKDEEK